MNALSDLQLRVNQVLTDKERKEAQAAARAAAAEATKTVSSAAASTRSEKQTKPILESEPKSEPDTEPDKATLPNPPELPLVKPEKVKPAIETATESPPVWSQYWKKVRTYIPFIKSDQ